MSRSRPRPAPRPPLTRWQRFVEWVGWVIYGAGGRPAKR